MLWYLYLTPAGEHCVLAALPALETYADPAATHAVAEIAQVARATWVCAPSFAVFIYRFWLENTIWFKLDGDEKAPLTDEERRFLEHYERARARN